MADQRGRYYAMNMMYNHTITVFNRRYKRVKTMDDSVDLSRFGHRKCHHRHRRTAVALGDESHRPLPLHTAQGKDE